MRKIVSLLVLLLTVFSISVQAEPWKTFLYGPFETDFNSIDFISSDEGWVVGDGEEVVLHYQRKGYVPIEPSWEDWKVDTRGFPKCGDDCTYTWNFNSVYFISPDEGWIVGENSNVFHYLNGIWSWVHVPVQGSLMSIYFLSPDEGWVVGMDYNFGGKEKGLILHYDNGLWDRAGVPTVSQGFWMLRSVHFTSSNEGWTVGYKLEDSGDYKGVMLHYLNGTWNLVNLDLDVTCWTLRSVYFISPNEGWAVGWDRDSTGIVLHYLNGTWNRENVGVLGRDWELNSVYFPSPDEGWIVGYEYSNSNLYTAYGGRGIILHYLNGVWSIIDQNLDNLILNSVNFTSPSEGWIAGQLVENKDCRPVLLKLYPYTVTASVGGDPLGGSVTPSSRTVNHGGIATFTVTTNTGYTASISEGTLTGTTWTIPNVTSTHTATVTFTINSYTVTASVGGDPLGGSVTPLSRTVNHGGTAIFAVTTNTGYTASVSEGTLSGNTWTIPNVTSSHTVTLTFQDITPPTGSIVINGGTPRTLTTSVTLSLSASDTGSGVSQMRFSNDGSTWSSWEAYGASKPWTLTPGIGTKTVYVQYQDSAGNSSGSFSDTILLVNAHTTPSEGTIGTEMTISGSGFGMTKGKVLVGTVAPNILEWTDSSIRCQFSKVPSLGTYGVTIQRKRASAMIVEDGFTVMLPDINSTEPTSGSAGGNVTIQGSFFGTKKGKVTLGGKTCKVSGWTMDSKTGESQIEFVVPKRLTPGANDLTVTNAVGSITTTFTVE